MLALPAADVTRAPVVLNCGVTTNISCSHSGQTWETDPKPTFSPFMMISLSPRSVVHDASLPAKGFVYDGVYARGCAVGWLTVIVSILLATCNLPIVLGCYMAALCFSPAPLVAKAFVVFAFVIAPGFCWCSAIVAHTVHTTPLLLILALRPTKKKTRGAVLKRWKRKKRIARRISLSKLRKLVYGTPHFQYGEAVNEGFFTGFFPDNLQEHVAKLEDSLQLWVALAALDGLPLNERRLATFSALAAYVKIVMIRHAAKTGEKLSTRVAERLVDFWDSMQESFGPRQPPGPLYPPRQQRARFELQTGMDPKKIRFQSGISFTGILSALPTLLETTTMRGVIASCTLVFAAFLLLSGDSGGLDTAKTRMSELKQMANGVLSQTTDINDAMKGFSVLYQCFKTGSVEPLFCTGQSLAKWTSDCLFFIETCNNAQRYQYDSGSGVKPVDWPWLSQQLSELRKRGNTLRGALTDNRARNDIMTMLASLDSAMESYMVSQRLSAHRQCPFGIHIWGKPGLGKTTLTTSLVECLGAVDQIQHPKVWAFSGDKQYFDGYTSDVYAVTMDDIGKYDPKSKVDPTLLEVISIINSSPYIIPMADVKDKGKISFTPSVVISTGNSEDMNAGKIYATPAAVWRRFKVYIHATLRQQFAGPTGELDPTKVASATSTGGIPNMWTFTVANPKVDSGGLQMVNPRNFTDTSEMLAYVADLYESHKASEQRLKQNATQPPRFCMHCRKPTTQDPNTLNRACPKGGNCAFPNVTGTTPAQVGVAASTVVHQAGTDADYTIRSDQSLPQPDFSRGIILVLIALLSGLVLYCGEQWIVYRLCNKVREYGGVVYNWCTRRGPTIVRNYVARMFDNFMQWALLRQRRNLGAIPPIPEDRPLEEVAEALHEHARAVNREALRGAQAPITMLLVVLAALVCYANWRARNKNHSEGIQQGNEVSSPAVTDAKLGIASRNYRDTRVLVEDLPRRIRTSGCEAAKSTASSIALSTARIIIRAEGHSTRHAHLTCAVSGGYFITTAHTFLPYKDCKFVDIEVHDARDVSVTFRRKVLKDIIIDEERDIAMLHLPMAARTGLVNPDDASRDLVIGDRHRGYSKFLPVTVPVMERDGLESKSLMFKTGQLLAPDIVEPNINSGKISIVAMDEGNETEDGDCGAPYLVWINEKVVFMGIHVAKIARTGLSHAACIRIGRAEILRLRTRLIKEIKLKGASNFEGKANCAPPHLQAGDDIGAIHAKDPINFLPERSTRVTAFGQIMRNGSPMVRSTFTSEVRDTPFRHLAEARGVVTDAVPPVVHRSKTRAKTLTDLTSGAYGIPLYKIQRAVNVVVSTICRDFTSFLSSNGLEAGKWNIDRPLTDHEALNGIVGMSGLKSIDMSTSAGYPYMGSKRSIGPEFMEVHEDGTIHPGPDFQKQVDDGQARMLAQGHSGAIFWQFYKDEATKQAKNDIFKTRAIFGAPAWFNHITRKVFGSAIATLRLNPFLYGNCPGVDPESKDWTTMAEFLKKDAVGFFDGDFKLYDTRVFSADVISCVGQGFCRIARHLTYHDEHVRQLQDAVIRDVTNPYFIMNTDLYRVCGMNPSGQGLTTHINGLAARSFITCAIIDIGTKRGEISEDQLEDEDFLIEFVRSKANILAFGDDSIVGSKDIHYNFRSVQDFFSRHGIEFTPGRKDEAIYDLKPLTQTDFLKRGFSESDDHEGFYDAPLRTEVFDKMLCVWRTSSALSKEEHSFEVLKNVLKGAAMHKRDVFEHYRGIVDYILTESHLGKTAIGEELRRNYMCYDALRESVRAHRESGTPSDSPEDDE